MKRTSFAILFRLLQHFLFNIGAEQLDEACLAVDGCRNLADKECAGITQMQKHQVRYVVRFKV